MSDLLKIALVQSQIHWQNTAKNLKYLDNFLSSNNNSDLIVLPEMFNTGFSMNPQEIAMPDNGGEVLSWMKEKAQETHSALIGSVAVKIQDGFVNRLYFVTPEGNVSYYDKRHLFRMAGENEHYINGEEKCIVEYKGWRINLQICYDLRFPVWSRNSYHKGTYDYDVLIYVANWPQPRAQAWRSLLQARAIENLAYAVGVNRVGEDGNGFKYCGDSRVFNYLGDRLDQMQSDTQMVDVITLQKEDLIKFRKKFPTGLDADKFELF